MSCCSSCASGGPCAGGSSLVVGARGGIASSAPREVRAVDDVLSSVWEGVRSFVPYGNVIDQAHQARRRLMYGDDAATATPRAAPRRAPARAPARSSSSGNPTVRMLQQTVRAASRGDAAASATLAAWKRAAASSPAMGRRWAAAVAVMRDDARRIERRTAAREVH